MPSMTGVKKFIKDYKSGIHTSEVAHLLDAELYNYEINPELIAHEPAVPRDTSRLLIFDTRTGTIQFDVFKSLAQYMPAHSLVVMNRTKVVPARVRMQKTTGGFREILFLVNEWERGSNRILALVPRGMRAGTTLYCEEYGVKLISNDEHLHTFELLFPPEKLFDFLNRFGVMPLPGYIRSTLTDSELRERYQTLIAEQEASVAAPTASLHFTDEVFSSLSEKGIERTDITLHVGLGTFEPLNERHLQQEKLHSEHFEIPEHTIRAIQKARSENRTVVAVGTTVLRALEASRSIEPSSAAGGAKMGETTLFIKPPYKFDSAEALITNFHVPYSSLMMLVEAFLQYKKAPLHLVDLYKRAIAERMRFYSFGDAMLIL